MTVENNPFSPDTSYAEAALAVLQGGLGTFIDKAERANKMHYENEDEDNPGEPPYTDELCRAQALLTQVQEKAALLSILPPKTEELLTDLENQIEAFVGEAEDIGLVIEVPEVPDSRQAPAPAV